MNASNPLIQLIQGQQLMPQHQQQRSSIISNAQLSNTHQSNNQFVSSTTPPHNSSSGTIKHNKVPQQILPKPAVNVSSSSLVSSTTSSSTSSISQHNNNILQQIQQQTKTNAMAMQSQSPPNSLSHQFQAQSQMVTLNTQVQHPSSGPNSGNTTPQPQQNAQQVTAGGSILLPTGNINGQPLLLNQVPLLVQQNTPQGVQLIIRPPTPQLATPSLVIHNRPQQLQQTQAQPLLRILNTNGMQLAATTPTFIVSSQANIIQQNLQSIKTPPSGTPQLIQTTQRNQPQQLTAINSTLLGQSVAQLQNLQLNGNLTQIQMPNGLNPQFISQLPAQFQQNISGFNQFNQLNSIQTASSAGNTSNTFQSPPPPPTTQTTEIVPTQNIQFTTQNQNMISSSPIATPQPQQILETAILTSPPHQGTMILSDGGKHTGQIEFSNASTHNTPNFSTMTMGNMEQQIQNQAPVKPKKTKKSKKKLAMEAAAAAASMSQMGMGQNVPVTNIVQPMIHHQQIQQQQQIQITHSQEQMSDLNSSVENEPVSSGATGKLDLANVMKLCGIMEDDDFDTDEPIEQQQPMITEENHPQTIHIPTENTGNSTDIMITIPGQNADNPFTFTIPANLDGTSISEMDQKAILAAASNSSGDDKSTVQTENTPFMIRIDPSDGQGGQPFTISIPQQQLSTGNDNNSNELNRIGNNQLQQQPQMCVPSFINNVLNTSVTPTIQSQINEIQNQLMAATTSISNQQQQSAMPQLMSTQPVKTPRKKNATKKSKKQMEKTLEALNVPTQIGNIQISQIDGNSMKNTFGNKNINNQIQITPIIDGKINNQFQNLPSALVEKQRSQVPVMQTSIAIPQQHQQHSHQSNQNQQQHGNSNQNQAPPSQVNINVQQNQLINVTNNLQMQVIANPGPHQGHTHQNNSNNTSQAQSHSSQQPPQTTSATINAQNLIGNLLNAQSNLQQQNQGGNIIIQQPVGGFNPQQHQQMPANIQVNIQNQTIANNIITTAPPPHQTQPQQTQNNNAQQPSAQSILNQLTGHLSLSFCEDGRLILNHDINTPQDAHSQMVLQAILTGALGNVSLVNEPLKQPQPQLITQQVIGANGKISQVTVQNKNMIITNQSPVQTPAPSPQIIQQSTGQIISSQPHIINQSQQNTVQLQAATNNLISLPKSDIGQTQQGGQQQIISTQHGQQQVLNAQTGQQIINTQTSSHQAPNQHQQQPQTVVMSPNILKFVELPKVQPNQQLFSLNTITNEITLLNPNQTTAALGPMERLLIVPSGINAQQLATCLSQGQIHFNNIGQVSQTTDPNKIQQQLQLQQQMAVNQQQQQQKANAKGVKDQPKLDQPKKGRGKGKKKLAEEARLRALSQANNPNMVQIPTTSPSPMQTIVQQKPNQVAKVLPQPIINSTISSTNVVTTMSNTKTIYTPVPSNINVGSKINAKQNHKITLPPTAQVPPLQSISKPLTTVPNSKSNTASTNLKNNVNMNMNSNNNTANSNNLVMQSQNAPQTQSQQILAGGASDSKSGILGQQKMPSLISMNTAPRVQTIQLTPQNQQSLKNVQLLIKQLSNKLKNTNLLSTITMEFDPNNPIHNNPLPVLDNIDNMTDPEIYNALQRLFVEQQKILATGKIIPTIPAAVSQSSHTINIPSSNVGVVQQNLPPPAQTQQVNQQQQFNSNSNSIVQGSNNISNNAFNPALIPTIKQEPNLPPPMSIQPPPLIATNQPSQPLMQIKTENSMLSPTSLPSLVSVSSSSTQKITISPSNIVNPNVMADSNQQSKFIDCKSNIQQDIKSFIIPIPPQNVVSTTISTSVTTTTVSTLTTTCSTSSEINIKPQIEHSPKMKVARSAL